MADQDESLEFQQVAHQQARVGLWTALVSGMASRTFGRDSQVIFEWADQAVKEFDSRFPAPRAVAADAAGSNSKAGQ